MALGGDIRQAIILALESQGGDALTVLAAQLRELEALQSTLDQQYKDSAISANQYEAASRKVQAAVVRNNETTRAAIELGDEYLAMQKKLAEMDRQSAEDAARGQQARIAGWKGGIDAVNDAIAKSKDLASQEERARVAAIEAIGDRARAYASAEQAQERATARQVASDNELKQQIGDLKRQRIDAYAAADEAVERHRRAANRANTEEADLLERVNQGMKSNAGEAMRARIDAYARAERSTDGWRQSMDALTKSTDKSDKSSSGAARAALGLSRAFEDISVAGPLGGLNNVSEIVQGIGRSAGLSAEAVVGLTSVISGLATGFYILYQNSESFKKIVDSGFGLRELARQFDILGDPLKDAADGIEGLQQKIDAINSKPIRLEKDFETIRTLTRELEIATRAAKEFESVNNRRSEPQSAASKAVTDAIVESGGAGHKFEDALIEIAKKNGTYGAGSEIHGQVAAAQEWADFVKKGTYLGGEFGAAASLLHKQALDQVNKLKDDLDKEQRRKIAQMVGLQHGEASRKTLEDIVNNPANEAAFASRGIDINRLGGGLTAARPENLFADERKKLAEEQRRKDDEKAKAIDKAALDAKVANEKAIDAQDKRVAEAEQEAEEQNQANRIRENKAAAAAAAKAETAHEKAAREAAARFGPGVDLALTQAATRHAAQGMTPGQNYNSLFGQLRPNLANSGVDGAILDDVAKAILMKVMDKVGNKVEAGVLAGHGNVQGVAGAMGAGQEQHAQQAMLDNLKTMARQEQMMGVVNGPFAQMFMQQSAMDANLDRQLKQLQDLPRRMRRPSGRQRFRK